MATMGDVTEEELMHFGVVRDLKLKPKEVETTEDFKAYFTCYEETTSSHKATDNRHLSRLSTFFKEKGNGWKYPTLEILHKLFDARKILFR